MTMDIKMLREIADSAMIAATHANEMYCQAAGMAEGLKMMAEAMKAVVDDCQVTVLGQVNVQFDAVATVQSGFEGSHGVFRNAVAVQTPVGIAPALQRLQTGMIPATHNGKQDDCQYD